MAVRAAEKPCRSAFSAFSVRAALTLGALPILGLAAASCYSTGDGASPPLKQIYYPVGLQVSAGGTVLYAVNSDFDLQFNGGTLQSYDLAAIRRDAAALIRDPLDPNVTSILDREKLGNNPCPARASSLPTPGETCAPPVDSSFYVRDTAVIGAFATDLVLSRPPAALALQSTRPSSEDVFCSPSTPSAKCPSFGTRSFDRLFAPVRGNASLTWASVERDSLASAAPLDPRAPYGPFVIQCDKDSSGRCGGGHSAGTDPDELGNTRRITMPGEPFGMAISPDGESIVITHQNETKTSLFSTGLSRNQNGSATDDAPRPFLQFVLDGLPFGGVGIAPIPHDRDAFLTLSAPFPRPAFLQTSRAVGQVSLLRQYPDEFGGVASSIRRPFLDLEGGFPITIGAGGADSRGVVIDPSPRIACKARVVAKPLDVSKGRTQDVIDRELLACARKPARVFIANRSPAALLVGEVGGSANANDDYDPDRLVIHTTVPLSAGPSKLYLAPVVERDGAYGLRVFAVCFDSATIFVYDPEAEQVENVIRVGLGPFAMAFDPFDMVDVATHAKAPIDKRHPETPNLKTFRFGYLASFTNSFIQLIDLDNDQGSATYQRVVFTLGRPSTPKGS